ncbi:MAG TPA: flavodoxin family protein [Armatimonadota bacterium]|nr:flavodoxin family protein [Armatimonadota bacterium]
MATVLAVLTSGRRSGFTSGLLERAVAGAGSVAGVRVDMVCSHDFSFGPCVSCFACVRDPGQACILDDDMGRRGEGALYRRIAGANALLIADPVHNWSPSASARLLVERCYPFVWNGALKGMPAASISCASNQGMHRLARQELCKWLFGMRTRWVGGVAAHVAALDRHMLEAHELGAALGQAALDDERDGREPWGDAECFEHYVRHAPWSPLQCYLDNLTDGTFAADTSVIARALEAGTFRSPRARELLETAQRGLVETLEVYATGDAVAASRLLAEASACWTHATWVEFLEEKVIGTAQPEAYRPLPTGREDTHGPA